MGAKVDKWIGEAAPYIALATLALVVLAWFGVIDLT